MIDDLPSIGERDLSLLLKQTRERKPLNTLIRLFLIETPCPADEVREATRPLTLESLMQANLIGMEGSRVNGRIKLLPFQGLIVAFDQHRKLLTDEASEYVMGIGRSTLTLANLTIRRPVRHALDLGAGCGIQALLAAAHAERVRAVDRNPRAVQMADFNARLNGMNRIECLEGNLFEPVRDHRFDLIVTNPPFVISPETRYIYRDGGMKGDELIQKIVRRAADHLTEGGFCHILCNWAETADQDWKDRLRPWFRDSGCDAWVIRSETKAAAIYAATWIRHTEKKEVEGFAHRFEAWTDYYERQSIRSIGAGIITLRRSAGRSGWFRAEDGPESMRGPCGEDMVLGFALRDYLESVPRDTDLMQAVLQISSKVRLDRESVPTARGWMDQSFRIRLSEGLAYSAHIDPVMANLMVRCNGRTPLAALVTQAADALGERVETFAPPVCGIVRTLISQGFLLPNHLTKGDPFGEFPIILPSECSPKDGSGR